MAESIHMSEADLNQLRLFQQEFDSTLSALLVGYSPSVAVLDFPRHQNAGDSLIWAGDMAALRRLGIDVGYVADIGRFEQRAMDAAVPDSPILLNGGGNFGDLWPVFQDERDRVVAGNHGRRIVCLPQTVRFASAERARVTNDIFASHGKVVLLVRDRRSLVHARELLPDVDSRLCVDAALANEPFSRRDAAETDVVALQRTDRESGGEFATQLGHGVEVTDWGLTAIPRLLWTLHRAPLAVYKRTPGPVRRALAPVVAEQYPAMIRLNLDSAASKLSRGRVVVTDRLHAHVLACLLGIPNVILENSYGKIRPIYEEYTSRFSTGHFAQSATEARAEAQRLLVAA